MSATESVPQKGNARSSGYDRAANDWYVEPSAIVTALLQRVSSFTHNGYHDPCCGLGTIPKAGRAMGIEATGADLIDRAHGVYPVRDYLADDTSYPGIVTNPPFNIAIDIVRHALKTTRHGGRVAIVAQAKFLFSQERHPLFTDRQCERVYILSRRPSMPPGALLLEKGEACRGGGFHDFMWIVWRVGKTAPGCSVDWVIW